MHHQLLIATTLLSATAESTKTFHIGPWIIVPILILIAIIGTLIVIRPDVHRQGPTQAPLGATDTVTTPARPASACS